MQRSEIVSSSLINGRWFRHTGINREGGQRLLAAALALVNDEAPDHTENMSLDFMARLQLVDAGHATASFCEHTVGLV